MRSGLSLLLLLLRRMQLRPARIVSGVDEQKISASSKKRQRRWMAATSASGEEVFGGAWAAAGAWPSWSLTSHPLTAWSWA